MEIFENRIRPVLAAECYTCHGAGKQKGGLRLDFRGGLIEGGDSGPVIDLEHPTSSLILRTLRHEIPGQEMPKDGAPLSRQIIEDFEKWVTLGAPDPRISPPDGSTTGNAEESWEAAMDFRRSWWCFQPIANPEVPVSETHPSWAWSPIDHFLQKQSEKAGLSIAGDASPARILRRLHLILTGLPPTYMEVESFQSAAASDLRQASAEIIDKLLQSPQFGEKWARHWMDWTRYADSHGSEGDPTIPYSWEYRDYLIRAINADVPLDWMIREHLAGDLLETPRINTLSGINESILGLGHYRMVLHGFAPTDALDELVRFTENQIDVTFKAFQGLTVSCARCHNHKFDPISQNDFYGLYGVMATTRPASISMDAPEISQRGIPRLQSLKQDIQSELIQLWNRELEQSRSDGVAWKDRLTSAARNGMGEFHPLFLWKEMSSADSAQNRKSILQSFLVSYDESRKRVEQRNAHSTPGSSWRFDESVNQSEGWISHGNTLSSQPFPSGSFAVARDGDAVIEGIHPGGYYTHTLSTRHRGVLESPRFRVRDGTLHLRVIGDGNAAARYVIQNYPRNGTVYPVHNINKSSNWRWVRFNMDYWAGDDAHVELATAADQPVLAQINQTRSWFGVTDILHVPHGESEPKNEFAEFAAPVIERLLASPEAWEDLNILARGYLEAIQVCVDHWSGDALTSHEARFLDLVMKSGLLTNSLQLSTKLESLMAEYRRLEEAIPIPRRAPGIHEGTPLTQKLMIRGNHLQLGQPIPRKFLDVFGGQVFESPNSGRLDLAAAITSPENPLIARVLANRIWTHVFGEGIVRTPDNFGRLGEMPTHPDLLDHLAQLLRQNDWSLKATLREILLTRTLHLSSTTDARSLALDPENVHLARFPLRRLEAESIRDSILAVSGLLDTKFMGPPEPVNSNRRSIYLRVQRNDLPSFLTTFDFPAPVSTLGKRDVTNVPAQSLQMMNSPFMLNVCRHIADSLTPIDPSNPNQVHQRIVTLFQKILGRSPSDFETQQSHQFITVATEQSLLLTSQVSRLHNQLLDARTRCDQLLSIGRNKAIAARNLNPDAESSLPPADYSWDFTEPDSLQGLQLSGDIHLTPSGLHFNGGFARSSPLTATSTPVTEKTLVALTLPANVTQRGAGILTLENASGDRFDSIVLGERIPGHWMAGSEVFSRTADVGGVAESMESIQSPIHIAIRYAADGTIAIFRNGEPYGQPYKSSGPANFTGSESHILFGLRHLPDNESKRFTGHILQAGLYLRALEADEIAALAQKNSSFVSSQSAIAFLTDDERKQWQDSQMILENVSREIKFTEFQATSAGDPWRDLTQSLMNLKEFIHLF